MFPGLDYYMLIADFKFNQALTECEFINVTIENVSTENYMPFAYRKGSARGGDITFTTKAGDIKKKFDVFLKQLKVAITLAKQIKEEREVLLFSKLNETVLAKKEIIVSALAKILENGEKEVQQRSGFTIRLTINGTVHYINELAVVQELLIVNGTSGKSNKYKVHSEGIDKTCSICKEVRPLVHGFGSPFKYATVDKVGTVSGFFKQKNNWRNYPICSACSLDFEKGRDYISKELRRNFYGNPYFIIPQMMVKDDVFLDEALDRMKKWTFQSNEGTKVRRKEDTIMKKIASEFGDYNLMALNLLFYEENQTTKAMKIKLALEEILPSRFRLLFDTIPKEIQLNPIYRQAIYKKKEKKDLIFSFRVFKDFFEDNFYGVIQSIFLSKKMEPSNLYTRFMNTYRSNRRKSQGGNYAEFGSVTIVKAHMVLAYLAKLQLIPSSFINKQEMEINSNENEITKAIDHKPAFNKEAFISFLERNNGFLDSPIKQGLFSVGILVKFLLNLQSANLGGKSPFENKLHGYHLDGEKLKRIYMDALTKIQQYNKSSHSYKELRLLIGELFIENSHQLKSMSNDEVSFYFVAGLELGNQFKNKSDQA